MKLWLYDGALSTPDRATEFLDEDHEWEEILTDPDVVTDKAKKTEAPAICGAQYRDGATSKEQTPENLIWCHALVLDVDYYDHPPTSQYPSRPPLTPDELKEKLDALGIRYIAFTTYSSSDPVWKWRVIIPFATPMPPAYYGPLWDEINGYLGGTMSESTRDAGRLGFVHIVNSETNKDSYRWWIGKGERLDWGSLDLIPEEEFSLKRALTPADLTRSPDWSPDADALIGAKRYFKRVGAEVEEGKRHETLLRIGCKLWWDWAFDENQVREMLHFVNAQFPLPKADHEVENEVSASWERTLGPRRVEQPTTYGAEREPIARLTKTAIAELGKRLKARNKESDRAIGRALQNASKEKAFGEPAEAKGLIMRAVDILAREYAHEPPERVVDLLRASLIAQRALSAQHAIPTDEEVKNKVRHTQHSMRQRLEEKQRNVEDKLREDIRIGTSGQRDYPYTEKERREWKQKGFGDRDWILKCGRQYYFWVNGRYEGEWEESSAAVVVYTKLAAAAGKNGPVQLHFIDKEGNARDKPFPQIMREYGRAARTVVHSMFEDFPRYDENSQTFFNSVCEVDASLTPEFNAEIDEWLNLLGQDKAELLKDWLAGSVVLDKPLSALHIVAPTNSGKNLIVNGMARLWHGRFQNLKDMNPALLRESPVVFCDEYLPSTWAYRFSTNLREFLSKNWHIAKDTGFTTIAIQGYARLIFSANDTLVNLEREQLSHEATDATMKRLLTIAHKDTSAQQYLLDPRRAAKLHEWVNSGIARHVLWLNENRKIDTRKRFLVEDVRSNELKTTLVSRHYDKVYHWVYTALSTYEFNGEALFAADPSAPTGRRLFLHPASLEKNWTLCMSEKDRPTYFELRNAVAEIASDRKNIAVKAPGAQKPRGLSVRSIDMARFEDWLQDSDLDLDLNDALEKLFAVRPAKVV